MRCVNRHVPLSHQYKEGFSKINFMWQFNAKLINPELSSTLEGYEATKALELQNRFDNPDDHNKLLSFDDSKTFKYNAEEGLYFTLDSTCSRSDPSKGKGIWKA